MIEIGGERHVGLQQLAQPLGDGRERELGLADLRAPEVRRQQQPCAALAQPLQRRQRGADPGVVGDARAVEGDVEVHPDEDALSVDAAEVVDRPHAAPAPTGTGSTFCSTSTQRFE